MSQALPELARHGLLNGTLPAGDTKAFGGRGTGAMCSLCGKAITPDMAQIELQCEPDLRFVLHSICNIAWERARELLTRQHEG